MNLKQRKLMLFKLFSGFSRCKKILLNESTFIILAVVDTISKIFSKI